MTTSRLAAVAASAVAALALAACGGASSDPTTGSSAESTDGATTAASGDAYQIGVTQILSHPSLDSSLEGFKAALADAGLEVEYDEQNAQGDQSTAASIAGSFAEKELDLILAIATPTAQAVVQAIPDVPILFTAVTDPASAALVASNEEPGANATGTSDKNPVTEQLELIQQLSPEATTVGIVYSSAEENSIVQVEWAEEAAAELGLTIEVATVSTSAEVQQAAESLDVDAFYIPTDNTVVSALEAVLQVAEQRHIPVIAAEGDSVERGAIATVGLSYYDLGYQTGEMAVRILTEGADPATMPVEYQEDLVLYLNTGAAERMGVTIPQDLLDSADPANITE